MTGCLKCSGDGKGKPAVFSFMTTPAAIQARGVERFFVQCTTCGFLPNQHWASKEQAERAWDRMWDEAIRIGLVHVDA